MKKLTILLLVFLAISCNHSSDPLFGSWQVSKIHVDFDEKLSTPDMVKQIGEMERQNHLEILPDYTMTFISGGYTLKGQLTMSADSTLLCNGELFGTWKDGKITTKDLSPFGEIIVEYVKE